MLRVPPMSVEEEAHERSLVAHACRVKIKGGTSKSLAVVPAVRLHGPIQRLVDLQGDLIDPDSRSHPCGPRGGRKVTAWMLPCGAGSTS